MNVQCKRPKITMCSSAHAIWQAGDEHQNQELPQQLADPLAEHAICNYSPPAQGMSGLCENWANYLTHAHMTPFLSSSMVIVPGEKFGIHALFAILAPTSVVIPAPACPGYEAAARRTGHAVRHIKCGPTTSHKITPNHLAFLRNEPTSRQIVLILNSPCNPTGVVYSSQEMEEICDTCKELGALVLFDGTYAGEYDFAGRKIYTPMNFIPEQTIYVGGMTKLFRMVGRRLGFLHLPSPELTKRAANYVAETLGGVDIVTQLAASDFFSSLAISMKVSQDYVRSSAIVARYVQYRLQSLGVLTVKPDGGCQLYASFAPFGKALRVAEGVLTSEDLARLFLSRLGVRALPGSHFADENLTLCFNTHAFDPVGANRYSHISGVISDAPMCKFAPSIVKGLDQIELLLSGLQRV